MIQPERYQADPGKINTRHLTELEYKYGNNGIALGVLAAVIDTQARLYDTTPKTLPDRARWNLFSSLFTRRPGDRASPLAESLRDKFRLSLGNLFISRIAREKVTLLLNTPLYTEEAKQEARQLWREYKNSTLVFVENLYLPYGKRAVIRLPQAQVVEISAEQQNPEAAKGILQPETFNAYSSCWQCCPKDTDGNLIVNPKLPLVAQAGQLYSAYRKGRLILLPKRSKNIITRDYSPGKPDVVLAPKRGY